MKSLKCEFKWYQPPPASLKSATAMHTHTMWYLLNVYMCEKVHVRAYMQCWREFAKCRFTHFPSFFSVHVDTYDMC